KLWKRRFDDPLSDAETFAVHRDGTLAQIGDKPETLDQVEGQYMGLLRISPRGWSEILRIRRLLTDQKRDRIDMTGLLQTILKEGNIPVQAIPYTGKWGEVDSANDLLVYSGGAT